MLKTEIINQVEMCLSRLGFDRHMPILKAYVRSHRQPIVVGGVALCSFAVGWLLPSPLALLKQKSTTPAHVSANALVEAKVSMSDGSVYEGSILASTRQRQGYGRLTTSDGSVYEGNWSADLLPYGTRTTPSSVYCGNFDSHLRNNGFGIITYTDAFVAGKRKQGAADHQITRTYIGNWRANVKEGLGRAVKMDYSVDFGMYSNGVLMAVEGMDYRMDDTVYGIDLSHYQRNIDWNNLALYCDNKGNVYPHKPAGRKYMRPVMFAYIKATEGATVKDEAYAHHSLEAERHGVVKGAYHFLHLGTDIDAQVKNFLETAGWTNGDLPPALDVEVEAQAERYGKSQVQKMTFEWLEAVERRLGVRPIIYTRERFRDKYLIDDPRFAKYSCWIARYNTKGPDNEDWRLWQLSETGVAGGYEGRVDINMYKGGYRSFMRYINGLGRR